MLVPGGKATMFSHWDSTWMTYVKGTVNLDIFSRILFSQIALKHKFVALNIRELGMIYAYAKFCKKITHAKITKFAVIFSGKHLRSIL